MVIKNKTLSKWIMVIVAIMVIVGLLPSITLAMENIEGYIGVYLNTHEISFKDMGRPEIVGDRTMIPVRAVSERMGYKVEWNEKDQVVSISDDETVIELVIGESVATVNGKEVNIDTRNGKAIDTRAYIQKGRTMVPIRFISETMGAEVEYTNLGDKNHRIDIYMGGYKPKEKPVEKPVEKPIDKNMGKDWIEPEFFAQFMLSEPSVPYTVYLKNADEYGNKKVTFDTKIVGDKSRYNYVKFYGDYVKEDLEADLVELYKNIQNEGRGTEIYNLNTPENARDKNDKPLPQMKKGDKFTIEITQKMNGKSKVYTLDLVHP